MNIKLNQEDIEEMGRVLSEIKNGVPRVLTTAINKTIINTQTEAVKKIGAKINLSAKRIKKDFKQFKANYQKLNGALEAVGGPVGLISFTGTKELARGGVSVKIYKDGSRSKISYAFIAKGKGEPKDPDNPKLHVWARKHFKGRPYDPKINYAALRRVLGDEPYALPLKRLTGPRIEDVYDKPEIFNPVFDYAQERFVFNLEHEYDYVLSKLK
jgi:hypothetical protein